MRQHGLCSNKDRANCPISPRASKGRLSGWRPLALSGFPRVVSSGTMHGMSLGSMLGPDGAIARRLNSYEPRPQQLRMADAVAAAIADKRHLMVEAGTGVG